tara:strand:- start:54 stop:443 length:390 start_codon:yes stop_codon:yes gene_type:complete
MKSGIILLLCASFVYAKPIEKIEVNHGIMVSQNKCVENDFNLNCSNFELNNNATCVLCKTLVSTIDYGIIKGNQTVQEITQVLKDICCMIHGPSGKECVFVLNNIQAIIKDISNGLTNLQICRKLHLCS